MTTELRWHLSATDGASKAFASIASAIEGTTKAMESNAKAADKMGSITSHFDSLRAQVSKVAHVEGTELAGSVDKVTDATNRQSRAMGLLKRAGGALMGVLSATAVGDFIAKSADAFSKGEQAELDLQLAYKKFPAIADVNIDKMKGLADQIETTTGYDHDAVIEAESKLAMYGLTGSQIQKLMPLVTDLAARQKIDLAQATTEVGRAMEGQARGLQTIGIRLPNATALTTQLTHANAAAIAAQAKYQASLQKLSDLQAVDSAKKKLSVADTVRLHDATLAVAAAKEKLSQATAKATSLSEGAATSGGRLGVIMSALRDKVGGFAEGSAKTMAGQTRIMSAEFDHLQEKVGGLVVPALTAMMTVGNALLGWLVKTPGAFPAILAGLAAVAAAMVVLNIDTVVQTIALAADPLFWIPIAIGAIITALVLLISHWSQVTKFITDAWDKFIGWIVGVINGFVSWWNGLWSGFAQWIVNEWDLFIKGIQILWNDLLIWVYRVVTGFQSWWNGIWTSVGNFLSMIWNVYIVGATRQVFNWLVSTIGGALNWIVSTWNNAWSGLGSIVKSIFHGIVSFVLGGVNMVIGAINGLISLADKVPGVSIPQLAPVKIPGYASGIDSAPGGLSIVGENGPELMNVPAGSSITPNGRTAVVALDEPTIRTLANYLAQAIVPGVQYHSENIAGAVVSAAFGG